VSERAATRAQVDGAGPELPAGQFRSSIVLRIGGSRGDGRRESGRRNAGEDE
jgi:hypothetical protein